MTATNAKVELSTRKRSDYCTTRRVRAEHRTSKQWRTLSATLGKDSSALRTTNQGRLPSVDARRCMAALMTYSHKKVSGIRASSPGMLTSVSPSKSSALDLSSAIRNCTRQCVAATGRRHHHHHHHRLPTSQNHAIMTDNWKLLICGEEGWFGQLSTSIPPVLLVVLSSVRDTECRLSSSGSPLEQHNLQ